MSPRRRRRLLVLSGALLLVAALLPGRFASRRVAAPASAASSDVRSDTVLVLRRGLPAGATVDPAQLRAVRLPADAVPKGVLRRVPDVAFRETVVSLPANLPLVPSLLRPPGADRISLRAGERAVGVRVDGVTGLPGLLADGTAVDVLVSTRDGASMTAVAAASAATVMGRPTPVAGEGSWAVVLRVDERAALRIASAQADGREVRLLARAEDAR